MQMRDSKSVSLNAVPLGRRGKANSFSSLCGDEWLAIDLQSDPDTIVQNFLRSHKGFPDMAGGRDYPEIFHGVQMWSITILTD
jgi:hypothetical protein